MRKVTFILLIFIVVINLRAQPPAGVHWSKSGNSYYEPTSDGIIEYSLPTFSQKIIVTAQQLVPKDSLKPLPVRNFFFSPDEKKILLYTNSKRVWRYDTRGDYWIYNIATGSLHQLGKGLPEASLMFAKFSSNNNKVAYVSNHNIYVEDVNTAVIKPLTTDGTDRLINGTFDWAYEEEFDCRDGFRWSPDGNKISYWKIDATKIRNFLMINNTDSSYSYNIPVEYPKVGESPSPAYIYVADINTNISNKMDVPGDPQQHYIPRMEWAGNNEIVLQQLNRKQNESKVMYCNVATGAPNIVLTEKSNSWIDVKSRWSDVATGWEWIKNGTAFLWVSEKDGWRHIYVVSRDGKNERLLTKGEYDVITINSIDDKNGIVYFSASPYNATQKYLYKLKIDGSGNLEMVSSPNLKGTHNFDISSNGLYAEHDFSNANTYPVTEWVNLQKQTILKTEENNRKFPPLKKIEFFQVTTEDGITMDGWMIKPDNFDSTKKYPVLFYVYSEPASLTVTDIYGTGTKSFIQRRYAK